MNKKELIKIREDIIKLSQDLGARKVQLILYGSCALLIILVLFFVYRPLTVKLRHVKRKFNALDAQVLNQRDSIAALKELTTEGRLMQQKEVSLAIDEITEQGHALGLKFVSITPKRLQKQAEGNFQVLPISFRIECTYARLGEFLVYLEEFPRSIAQVEALSIRPKKTLLKLDVELVVNLYIEAEGYGNKRWARIRS